MVKASVEYILFGKLRAECCDRNNSWNGGLEEKGCVCFLWCHSNLAALSPVQPVAFTPVLGPLSTCTSVLLAG